MRYALVLLALACRATPSLGTVIDKRELPELRSGTTRCTAIDDNGYCTAFAAPTWEERLPARYSLVLRAQDGRTILFDVTEFEYQQAKLNGVWPWP